VWALAAACAAVIAAVVAVGGNSAQVSIAPGTAVLSVQDAAIRTLSYRTGTMALTARRSASMGAFTVEVTYTDGRPAQQCEAARDLTGLLPELVKITVKRQLTPQQALAEFPVQLGTLVLEDQIASEPINPFVVRATRDRSKVAMVFSGTAVEPTTSPAAFAKLDEGCAALAGK
jgi:hypothetical protein